MTDQQKIKEKGNLRGKELRECQGQRDNALLALRAIIGTIEARHDYRPSYAVRELEILAIAKKALEAE